MTKMKHARAIALQGVALAALLVLLTAAPAAAEVPDEPASFSDPLDIDNTYHPFIPRRIRHYTVERALEDLDVIDVFLSDTRTFSWDGDDVTCATLQEWEIEDGEVVEISWNYFAQDDDGTVWYFGEVVDIYEDGEVVSHEGSWLVGGGGEGDPEETLEADAPAVFMPGDVEIGDVWKPEDLPEEDLEEFVRAHEFLDELEVQEGLYEDILRVREKTPDIEWKWYGAGFGFLQSRGQAELLSLEAVIDNDDDTELEDALEDLLDAIGA